MSNWSVVILTWKEKGADPRQVLTGVSHAINPTNPMEVDWRLTPGLTDLDIDPEDIPGCAIPSVAVTHVENFLPEPVLAVLATAPFESPDDVELLWKDENSEMFRRERLRTYLDRKAAPRPEYELAAERGGILRGKLIENGQLVPQEPLLQGGPSRIIQPYSAIFGGRKPS